MNIISLKDIFTKKIFAENFFMSDETVKLSAKSWARTVDCINKVGYSDGVVDGKATSFQFSFDMGYKQGFEFGFKLGARNATNKQCSTEDYLSDSRRINCQICLSNGSINDNVMNLYNNQHELNKKYFSTD